MDISEETIPRVQFWLNYKMSNSTAEFDNRITSMRRAINQKNVEIRIELLRWIASQICEAGVEPMWVTTHT